MNGSYWLRQTCFPFAPLPEPCSHTHTSSPSAEWWMFSGGLLPILSLSLLRFGLGLHFRAFDLLSLGPWTWFDIKQPSSSLVTEHIKRAWACPFPRKHQTTTKNTPGKDGARMLCSLGYPGSPGGRETVQPDAIKNWWRPGISRGLDMDGDIPEMPNNVWVQRDPLPGSLELIRCCHIGKGQNLYFSQARFFITHSYKCPWCVLYLSLACVLLDPSSWHPWPYPYSQVPRTALAVSSPSPPWPPFPLSILPCAVLYPVSHLLHQGLITQDRHELWESRSPNWMFSLLFPSKTGTFSCIYSNIANSSMITPHCPCQGTESHLVPEHRGLTAQAILSLPFAYCKPGVCKTLSSGAPWFLPNCLEASELLVFPKGLFC